MCLCACALLTTLCRCKQEKKSHSQPLPLLSWLRKSNTRQCLGCSPGTKGIQKPKQSVCLRWRTVEVAIFIFAFLAFSIRMFGHGPWVVVLLFSSGCLLLLFLFGLSPFQSYRFVVFFWCVCVSSNTTPTPARSQNQSFPTPWDLSHARFGSTVLGRYHESHAPHCFFASLLLPA